MRASCNLDPAAFERVITPKTKAVVPVHLYGRPAAMGDICGIASRRGISVVEDAAQAHGAKYRGKRAGSLGIAGCFSFYPTKNLGAFGDAGLITTDDGKLAERVALLRDHGRVSKYEHSTVGYTARLDNLQAAVLRVQADMLDEWNARRRQVAGLVSRGAAGGRAVSGRRSRGRGGVSPVRRARPEARRVPRASRSPRRGDRGALSRAAAVAARVPRAGL